MQDLVDPVLAALPDLLRNKENWKSLYIDYEPPYLMRLALPLCGTHEQHRINISLHYFFGKPGSGASDMNGIPNPYANCPDAVNRESVNNYHPHPWAAAFHLFEGSYNQNVGRATQVGYSADLNDPIRPSVFATWLQDSQSSQHCRYAFNDKMIWHQVLPNEGQPVTSLMITYIPQDWDQVGPRPPQAQRPLNALEHDFMFAHFLQLLSAASSFAKQDIRPTP